MQGHSMRTYERPAGWTPIAKAVGRRIVQDALPGRAAEMSFYFFLSVFPVLLILVAGLGYFPDTRSLIREAIVGRLDLLAPAAMVQLLARLLDNLTPRSGTPLSIGIVVAVWAASSGMVATIRALNRAYAVRDEGSWWGRRAVAIALTLVFMLLTAAALNLLAYGGPLVQAAAQRAGMGPVFVVAWRIGQWPVIFGVLLVAFHVLYRFAPHRANPHTGWLQPGTLIGVALWLCASLGLKVYVANFTHYDLAYGSLGAVIVLLLWFYFTGMAVLAGAEINAQVEKARSSP